MTIPGSFQSHDPPIKQTIQIVVRFNIDNMDAVFELINQHEGHRDPEFSIINESTLIVRFPDPPGLEDMLVRQLLFEIRRIPEVRSAKQVNAGEEHGTDEHNGLA